MTADQERRTEGLAVAGFVMMVIFPIGGFIAGAVLLARRAALGAVIMMLSVASAFVWYELLTVDDDLDCAIENADRAIEGLPPLNC